METMRVYYLTSGHWAKKIVEQRRLKLSRFDDLNDPFELLGAAVGEKRARAISNYMQKKMASSIGLICTSSTWRSPVMWAHYGDKHKGVCLGFDVDKTLLREVVYEPHRLTGLHGDPPSLANIDRRALDLLATTKFQEWAYEKEWRILVSFHPELRDGDLHFVPFDEHPQVVLRDVMLGHRCTWTTEAAARAVGTPRGYVKVMKVRPSFEKFEMVRQQRIPEITVKPKRSPA